MKERNQDIVDEVLKPAAWLGLSDSEYAEFLEFLESLPEPKQRTVTK